MLKKHRHKTLHRAERRTVDHDRTMFLIVGARIFKTETLRKIVVHLDSSELPAASDGILHHEVKLRPVKRGLAFNLTGLQSFLG